MESEVLKKNVCAGGLSSSLQFDFAPGEGELLMVTLVSRKPLNTRACEYSKTSGGVISEQNRSKYGHFRQVADDFSRARDAGNTGGY